MLHGVMDETLPTAWVPLRARHSMRQLSAALTILKRHYQFVSLDEMVHMIGGHTPPRPDCLAVTFDDGYRNNLTHALPILDRHGISATFFLATGHVSHQTPLWFDRLDYALQRANVNGLSLQVAGTTVDLTSHDRDSLRQSYERLRNAAKDARRPDEEMSNELSAIADRLELSAGCCLANILKQDDWSAILTWREIEIAARRGVSFGSHTIDHVRVGRIDDANVRDQLLRSKQEIERHTGKACHHLCYPNGDFSDSAVQIARECGYVSAVTCMEGRNRVGEDLMKLHRVSLPLSGSSFETIAFMCGLVDSLQILKKRLSI